MKIKLIAPKIIKIAIKKFYKTLFWLLGQFSRTKYAKLNQKTARLFNKTS